MALLLTTLIIITCILLIIIVLVQNPKGGGLSSSFGGSGTQLFGGVKKTSDFLDRGTWALAIALVVLVLFANVTLKPTGSGENELPQSQLNNVDLGQPAQQMPAQQMPAGEDGDFQLPEEVEE